MLHIALAVIIFVPRLPILKGYVIGHALLYLIILLYIAIPKIKVIILGYTIIALSQGSQSFHYHTILREHSAYVLERSYLLSMDVVSIKQLHLERPRTETF